MDTGTLSFTCISLYISDLRRPELVFSGGMDSIFERHKILKFLIYFHIMHLLMHPEIKCF